MSVPLTPNRRINPSTSEIWVNTGRGVVNEKGQPGQLAGSSVLFPLPSFTYWGKHATRYGRWKRLLPVYL